MADARRIGVPLDFSPGSKYALQWGLQNIAKEGDAVVCIVVNKKVNEIGDMHLWQDTGSRK
jgi:nucleotide-binding universal stress UspA family protein